MRITLSWEYCDICKRRNRTTLCKINNKEFIKVCPHCIALLSEIIECNGGQMKYPRAKTKEKGSKVVKKDLLDSIEREINGINSSAE
ncbi:hypothetical protein Calag_1366 [Caldisphaera lagunensis DSM 15908]|uniref:Uncharacterized protein n=1 Tax=Caldisphaera lagunensis (strain DSM 15908 / JCM 11604 / ANMR 0165 / IC-154) TaxID=1056495 RepID=L0ADE8_CALLD|nr:hypothetical protein [Caldisphaera lagunensis]AFZ71075.1 hypothetical protein Calag_1366 [Caldisphaera lagunensis DSM 15908]